MTRCATGCQRSTTPNARGSCVKCGHAMPPERARNVPLERELTRLAARAAGYTDGPLGLDDVADHRAHPGGVRSRDFEREAREELADCRSYLVWACEPVWEAHLAGDPEASATVERCLRALAGVVTAWRELHREAT